MGNNPKGDRARRLDDMVVFARVVEQGSVTRAARLLGTTRSAVSKSIARLEAHLRTRLLHRTTRELKITAAGEACYVHCARISDEAEQAERTASALRETPQGVLRVSCALGLGMMLAPVLPAFVTRHPQVVLELHLSEAVVDLVAGRFDVGVRMGKLPDSSLVTRRLFAYTRMFVASPAYVQKNGAPRTPADLAKHNCVTRVGHDRWQFKARGRAVAVPVKGNYRADTPELLRQAAIAGLGVTMIPSFMVASDVARGALVPLLSRHAAERFFVHAVFPHHRHLAASARAFVDFLVDVTKSEKWESS
jgi:DNA-binding transcriptional LysR family regulator